MSVREIFRNNLRFYRKQNCLTQEALSEKIGLNSKYIADIETRGKFPSAETIDAIASALHITPAQLFLEQEASINILEFDKKAFASHLVAGISDKMEDEVVRYLEKCLPQKNFKN